VKIDRRARRVVRDSSIADVPDSPSPRRVAFRDDREVVRLQPIVEVGLEYVEAPPAVPTLGARSAALKLAGFSPRPRRARRIARKGTLFLFDEPTTGLHFDDIAVDALVPAPARGRDIRLSSSSTTST
jgi:excinuclease ABC subunit A